MNDLMEYQSKKFDLLVFYIPYCVGEDITALYHQLCFKLQIGYVPLIRSIYRVTGMLRIPTILLKFYHLSDKILVYDQYHKYSVNQPLTINTATFPNSSKHHIVLMRENLTKRNYNILKKAGTIFIHTAPQNALIKRISIKYGIVYICTSTMCYIKIQHSHELDDIPHAERMAKFWAEYERGRCAVSINILYNLKNTLLY